MKMLQVITPKKTLVRFALDSILWYEIRTESPESTKIEVNFKPFAPRQYGGGKVPGDYYTIEFTSRELAEAAISIIEL